jgi:putative flippase GtrA
MRATAVQLARYCGVGASGYGVNLAVSAFGLAVLDLPVIAVAVLAFGVAATSNFVLNRRWTFASRDPRRARQGGRFLVASLTALACGLTLLSMLVAAGVPDLAAQALSVAAATPVGFALNRRWTFAGREALAR